MQAKHTDQPASLLPVGLFTLTYMALAVVGAFQTGNAEFVIYIVVMFLLMAVVAIVHRHHHLSAAVLWGLSVWGLAHMAGGLVRVPESWPIDGDIRVLYSVWLLPGRLKYDQVVHAYGFFVTAWVCWQVMQSVMAARTGVERREVRPTLSMLVLCTAASMGFGAFNEVIEFAATLTVPETNVGGYINTGWDLVSNMVGAVMAAVTIWARDRASHGERLQRRA